MEVCRCDDDAVDAVDAVDLKIWEGIHEGELLDAAEQIMQIVGIDFHALDGRKRRKILLELMTLPRVQQKDFSSIEKTHEG